MNRRSFLKGGAALAAAGCAAEPSRRYQRGRSPWPICLDTATIRNHPKTGEVYSVREKIRIAAEAGFDAIEPWDGELATFEKEGGNLADLGREIRDRGLFVPSVIGLWNAIPATKEEWDKRMPATRERLRMVSAVGAQHVQVIPQPPQERYDGKWMADRYREILEIGLNEYNVNPALVFVKFLPQSKRLGQAAAVAIDADHPKAKIIPDVFHMHIGDSGFNGLKHLRGDFIAIFQFNDAPADPPKEKLEDKHRVYPGDGILPLKEMLRDLRAIGYAGCISLELYNPDYWKQDHLEVAKTGLRKTLEVILSAVG